MASRYSTQPEAKQDLSENMKKKIRAEYLAIGVSPSKSLRLSYFLNIIIGVSACDLVSFCLGTWGRESGGDFNGRRDVILVAELGIGSVWPTDVEIRIRTARGVAIFCLGGAL